MTIVDVNLKFGDMNYNNNPESLIVHHIEAEGLYWTVNDIHNMHIREREWAGIGYHYYIRLSGAIFKGRPDEAIGAHCQGCNSNTLGIAFEGNYDKRTDMPEAQMKAWNWLKDYLRTKYGRMNIYGHREKGNSACPGSFFPLDDIKKDNTLINIGWNKNNVGWWYVFNNDGEYHKDKWSLIDGDWYYFDQNGYAESDKWIFDKGKWYRLKSDCRMAKSQWLWVDSTCYCFDENGAMYADCVTPDGYTVDSSGAWVK